MSTLESPIAKRTKSAFIAFGQLRDALLCPKDNLTVDDVADELDRFRLWAGNIGAAQSLPSRLSLDYRLRDSKTVAAQVLRLLDDLNDSLADACAIVRGERENRHATIDNSEGEFSDEDLEELAFDSEGEVSELRELFLSVKDSTGGLFRLSFLIRKATPRDRYLLASTSTDKRYDESFDIAHVGNKFPRLASQENDWLRIRLGKAITLRREFLRYCREHGEHLKKDDNERAKIDKSKTYQGRDRDTSTAASTFMSVMMKSDTAQEDDFDGNESETSFATSDGGRRDTTRLRVIPLREVKKESAEFECPYCRNILNITKERSWKRHVMRDLKPYVCTFQGCDAKLFPERRAWFKHELEQHRVKWKCRFCPKTIAAFSSRRSLEIHIESHHSGKVVPETLPTLLELCCQPLDRIAASDCPFCGDFEKKLRLTNSRYSAKDIILVSQAQFRRHVGFHMEQLALFALPKHHSEKEEADSNAYTVSIHSKESSEKSSGMELDEGENMAFEEGAVAPKAIGKKQEESERKDSRADGSDFESPGNVPNVDVNVKGNDDADQRELGELEYGHSGPECIPPKLVQATDRGPELDDLDPDDVIPRFRQFIHVGEGEVQNKSSVQQKTSTQTTEKGPSQPTQGPITERQSFIQPFGQKREKFESDSPSAIEEDDEPPLEWRGRDLPTERERYLLRREEKRLLSATDSNRDLEQQQQPQNQHAAGPSTSPPAAIPGQVAAIPSTPADATTAAPRAGPSRAQVMERPRQGEGGQDRVGVSSYWSVGEQAEVERYFSHYGTDWVTIAGLMQTKAPTMVENYYQRKLEKGDRALEQEALAANEKRRRGEDIGPPPVPTHLSTVHRDTSHATHPRTVAPNPAAIADAEAQAGGAASASTSTTQAPNTQFESEAYSHEGGEAEYEYLDLSTVSSGPDKRRGRERQYYPTRDAPRAISGTRELQYFNVAGRPVALPSRRERARYYQGKSIEVVIGSGDRRRRRSPIRYRQEPGISDSNTEVPEESRQAAKPIVRQRQPSIANPPAAATVPAFTPPPPPPSERRGRVSLSPENVDQDEAFVRTKRSDVRYSRYDASGPQVVVAGRRGERSYYEGAEKSYARRRNVVFSDGGGASKIERDRAAKAGIDQEPVTGEEE
ncbi:hypothetical protein BDY21DRAFT_13759 [Lineolata rhizophorae]|uniref:Myb-like domain-containing protein n=1 Tax=Lineolata rhizophorae TaxID=578093 RepID=A0A6A6PEZ6_9PEZI|nr:hypothetical protein BDY21DRAFT_13759 [Lineolata rhizophorae]